jgi:general secretion pathway protein L
MAVKICGIDVGAYSVKVCFYESGLRRSSILGYFARQVATAAPAATGGPLPPAAPGTAAGDGTPPAPAAAEQAAPEPAVATGPLTREQLDALAQLTGGQRIKADSLVVAAPGDITNVRYLSFPFSDARKIAPVVGYELEGQIPLSLDEVTYDHLILPMRMVPSAGQQTRVLVAAAARKLIRKLLDGLESAGVDPNVVTVAPLAYGFLADITKPTAQEPMLVLDVGHRRTNFCILAGGRPVFVRTISRGGYHVTAELARALNLDFHAAEHVKHRQAMVPVAGQMAHTTHQGVTDAVRTALKPWNTGLRQSLSAAQSDLGLEIGTVLLCGGGSLLRGMDRHVADVMGLPSPAVTHVPEHMIGGQGPDAVCALGLCQLASGRRRDALNLRRGELAPVSGTSLLREKALTLAMFLVAAMGLLVLNGWVKLSVLRKEQAMLAKELSTRTRHVLGKTMNKPNKVLKRIAKLRRKKGAVLPIPRASAFAVLTEISRRTPPKNRLTLDVKKIEIERGRILVKGTAASAGEAEQLKDALKKVKCFETVDLGRTTGVGHGEEKKSEFTITIKEQCM